MNPVKEKKNRIDKEVDEELIRKGKDAIKDFDESQEFMVVPPKNPNSKMISIRLPAEMILRLREVAKGKGDIGYQQLIKIYLAEGLMKDEHFLKGREGDGKKRAA